MKHEEETGEQLDDATHALIHHAILADYIYSVKDIRFLKVTDATIREVIKEIKVDEVLEREKVPVKAIRVYSGKTNLNLNSSVERGEEPSLYIQKTLNRTRGEEFQIVLMGDYHVEEMSYYRSDPKGWKSFGHIVLSPNQARALAGSLLRIRPWKREAEEKEQDTLNDF